MPPPERRTGAAQRSRKPTEARGTGAGEGRLLHVGRVTEEEENSGGKYPGNRDVLDHLEFYSDRQRRVRT